MTRSIRCDGVDGTMKHDLCSAPGGIVNIVLFNPIPDVLKLGILGIDALLEIDYSPIPRWLLQSPDIWPVWMPRYQLKQNLRSPEKVGIGKIKTTQIEVPIRLGKVGLHI